MRAQRLHDSVNVVRHHAPGVQAVAFLMKELQCSGNDLRNSLLSKDA